jgi:Zn-dependent peptidase ImmA (M78 family)
MKITRQYELRTDAIIALGSKYRSLEGQALKLVNYEITKSSINRSPVDIDGLKTYLGVKDIRYTQLYSKQKGRLISEGNFFAIEISDRLDNFQRKLTILHELAHIILEDKFAAKINLERSNIKAFSKNLHPKVLEKLCDGAAKEILLPKSRLREELRGRKPSLKHLYEMSEKYNYPLEFIATRILDVGLWQFRVLWWRVSNNKATCVNSLPLMDELTLLDTKLLDESNSIVINSHLSKKYIEGMQKIVINNVEDEYRAQVLPEKKDVVICMLVYP